MLVLSSTMLKHIIGMNSSKTVYLFFSPQCGIRIPHHCLEGPCRRVQHPRICPGGNPSGVYQYRHLQPRVVLLGHTAIGKDLAPRVAERVKAGLVPDCVDILIEGDEVSYIRPIYGGKAFARLTIHTPIQFATLRPNMFGIKETHAEAEVLRWSGDLPEPRAVVEGER